MVSVKSWVGQVVRAVFFSLPIFPKLSTPLHFGRALQAKQPSGSVYWAMHLLLFENCEDAAADGASGRL